MQMSLDPLTATKVHLDRQDGDLPWWSKSGGWYPSEGMKGDSPDAANTRELCAYSIHGNQKFQTVGWRAVTHLLWFMRSV